MRRYASLVIFALLCAGCSSGGGVCSSDADCGVGTYCRLGDGQCVFDCTFNADCPTDTVCDTARGLCVTGCRKTNGGVEICDGLDNDCDGSSDEGQDSRACAVENALGRCPGTERCLGTDGWVCDAATPAAEECDGLDQDCDGEADEGLDDACPLVVGVCAGARRTCLGAAGWSECEYGSDYEAGAETRCDQLDNDCDGWTDEDVAPLPNCELGAQAHDGLDNNCNGAADEPGGCMAAHPLLPGVFIDTYEASIRDSADCSGQIYGVEGDDYPAGWPDGSATPTVTLYACSLPGVRPSRSVTYYQARRACLALGKRLCTKDEWAMACGGEEYNQYPYGPTYQPTTCNTFSAGFGDTVATGFLPGCTATNGAHDLSGNLWEWVETVCLFDDTLFHVQGGSYACAFLHDVQGWVECDLSDPTHAAEITNRHDCQYPSAHGYCSGPLSDSEENGLRCCWDRH